VTVPLILALLVAPAPESLTQPWGRARTVDASQHHVFGIDWREPVVRTGFFRRVGDSLGSPALSREHKGSIIVGQSEGEVRALRLTDGKTIWRVPYRAPFETAITLTQVGGREVALAAARDGTMLALAVEDGREIWRASLDADARAPATIVGERLLVSTVKNKVFLLERATGKVVWSEGRPPPTGLTINGHSKPCVHDGVVYATFSDGYAEAYRLEDASRVWSRPLSFGGEFVDADADPFVARGRVYAASYADGVYALDPKDGKTIWSHPAPAVAAIAPFDDMIIAASADGWVWAFDLEEGKVQYRTRLPPGPVSRLLVRDNLIVLTAGTTGLVVLDAPTGKPLQATALGGRVVREPVWEGDRLALLTSTGYVYALTRGGPGLVR